MSVDGRGGLLRHADFRRLFIAHSVTRIGTQVSWIAIPLVAITHPHAGTFEVGVRTALESVAWLLIGLPVGAWCDRTRRRRVLVVTDLIRAAALLTVPPPPSWAC